MDGMNIDLLPALALAIVGIGLGAALSSWFNRHVTPTFSGVAIGLTIGCALLFAYACVNARARHKARDIDCWKWDQLGLVFHDMERLEAENQSELVRQRILVLDREFTNTFYDDNGFDRMIRQLRAQTSKETTP